MYRLSLVWPVLLAVSCLLADGEETKCKVTLTSKLSDKRINESSGLAASRRTPGIFWTLNDSGGGPFIFAMNANGDTLTRCEIDGASNFDWEDMASGVDRDGKPVLFIGDIGDNFHIRSEVEIYQIEEPVISAGSAGATECKATLASKLRASFPDGHHNAEALLCHPKTGRLFVITKSETGVCDVYGFPEVPHPDTCMSLEHVAQFRIPPLARVGKRPIDNCMATGACFSPDGSRVVVSTYSSLYEWKLDPHKSLADAFEQMPLRIVPPLMVQCEAVCFSPDGKNLWLTSEQLPTPLYRIEAGN